MSVGINRIFRTQSSFTLDLRASFHITPVLPAVNTTQAMETTPTSYNFWMNHTTWFIFKRTSTRTYVKLTVWRKKPLEWAMALGPPARLLQTRPRNFSSVVCQNFNQYDECKI